MKKVAKYVKELEPFRYGLTKVASKKGSSYEYGVIDAKGKEVKIGKYTNYTYLAENLYTAHDEKKGGRILVDQKGKQLSDEVYQDITRKGDVLLVKRYSAYGVLDLNLNTLVRVTYVNVYVGYESKVVAVTTADGYALYNVNDLTAPLLETTTRDIHMTPESPYITWRDSKLGWFVYDCVNHVTY